MFTRRLAPSRLPNNNRFMSKKIRPKLHSPIQIFVGITLGMAGGNLLGYLTFPLIEAIWKKFGSAYEPPQLLVNLNKASEKNEENYGRSYHSLNQPSCDDYYTCYNGTMREYVENASNLKHLTDITVLGKEVKPGIFATTIPCDDNEFNTFMLVLGENKAKFLDLTKCQLNPKTGLILGKALETNQTLNELSVTSNQLEKEGVLAILNGLQKNTSLKILYMRAYNVDGYTWSAEELMALRDLIYINTTLTMIVLPGNKMSDDQMHLLAKPFLEITDRPLPKLVFNGNQYTTDDFQQCPRMGNPA